PNSSAGFRSGAYPSELRPGLPARQGARSARAGGRLDVVAIRVEHERSVVAVGVLRSQTGSAVIAPSGRERGRVERVHLFAAVRGEGDMNRSSGAIRRGDHEVDRLFEAEEGPGRALPPGHD